MDEKEIVLQLRIVFNKTKHISGKKIVNKIVELKGVSIKEAEEIAERCLKLGYIKSENTIRNLVWPHFSQHPGRYYRFNEPHQDILEENPRKNNENNQEIERFEYIPPPPPLVIEILSPPPPPLILEFPPILNIPSPPPLTQEPFPPPPPPPPNSINAVSDKPKYLNNPTLAPSSFAERLQNSKESLRSPQNLTNEEESNLVKLLQRSILLACRIVLPNEIFSEDNEWNSDDDWDITDPINNPSSTGDIENDSNGDNYTEKSEDNQQMDSDQITILKTKILNNLTSEEESDLPWFGRSCMNHPSKSIKVRAPFSMTMDEFEAASLHLLHLNYHLSTSSSFNSPSSARIVLDRYKAYLIIVKERMIELNLQSDWPNKHTEDWMPYPPDKDVHCVFIAHAIRTLEYIQDIFNWSEFVIPSFLGRQLDDKEFVEQSSITQSMMRNRFPQCIFNFGNEVEQVINQRTTDQFPSLSINEDDLIEDKNWLANFNSTEITISPIHSTSPSFILDAIKDYERFLYLLYHYNERKDPLVNASYKIDLIWHTHMLNTLEYMNDIEYLIGRDLHHKPWPKDRTLAEEVQIKSFSSSIWFSEFALRNFLNF